MAEFIVVFREVLEASLIIGILYTFLNKTNQHAAIAQLWKGVYLALIASVVGSVLYQKLLGGFTGQAEKLFEGIGNRFKDRDGGYTRIIRIPSSNTKSKFKSYYRKIWIRTDCGFYYRAYGRVNRCFNTT